MKLLRFGVLALFVMGIAGTARADWDASEIAKVQKKVQEGAIVSQFDSYPNFQVVYFRMGLLVYIIDLKTQICYASGAPPSAVGTGGIISASCKTLKKAYPLMAPLITWEE